MKDYGRSDLACEVRGGAWRDAAGARLRERTYGSCRVEYLDILDDACARRTGKPRGRYITLHSRPLWQLEGEARADVVHVLSRELRRMSRRLCGARIDEHFGVLVAGLGNADITADAIGPRTAHLLTATRHLHAHDRAVFRLLRCCQLSVMAPGVLGQTGMEAADLIRGAVQAARPHVVVAIDALAARSTARLAATIQLSDTGISPGSGIGNRRQAVDRAAVGVPVMALGVPTVVDSATLVYDALRQAGIEQVDETLRRVLESGRRFYVTPGESDCITAHTAALLADAIEQAFSLEEGAYSAAPRA